MARNFTIQWTPDAVTFPPPGVIADAAIVPTTGRHAIAFDATVDELIDLEAMLPPEYTGTGTLKLTILACANTTTAANDARIDVVTEFRTAGAAEAANADNFDGTPDSGTMTFSTTAYSLQSLTITLTPSTTPADGDKFRIRVSRDANNGGGLDDLAVDLLVVGFEFYEEV